MALAIVAETPAGRNHAGDVLCLVCGEDIVYTGGDDCVIKVWDRDLQSSGVLGTLGGAVMALCAAEGKVWAAAMGSELWHWPSKEQPPIQLLTGDGGEIGVLLWKDGKFYTGDDGGNVNCFVDNQLKLIYNLLEEVKDLVIDENRMYTVRDLDVTVTEFITDSTRYMTLATFEGRAPLQLLQDLLLVIDRTGKNINIYRNSKAEKFCPLGEVKVSEMILTSLCVAGDLTVWTGGWDGIIRRWTRRGDTLQQEGEIDVGKCVNAIVSGGNNRVYAAIEGGRVAALEFI